jgi:hypothetical protein
MHSVVAAILCQICIIYHLLPEFCPSLLFSPSLGSIINGLQNHQSTFLFFRCRLARGRMGGVEGCPRPEATSGAGEKPEHVIGRVGQSQKRPSI